MWIHLPALLHSIRNLVGSRMLASVLIWRWPFCSHLCLQVFWGQMFSPADNCLNKHIWALLLSVFSTEIWGTGSQKRLPRYLFFLLSCNPWHPDGTQVLLPRRHPLPEAGQERRGSCPQTRCDHSWSLKEIPWLPGVCGTNAIQEMATRNSQNNNVYCCTAWYMEAYVLVLG